MNTKRFATAWGWGLLGLTLILLWLVSSLSTGLPVSHAAGSWYVAPGGDDGNNCLNPSTPCATINGAIDKTASGDTIYVATGTYTDSGNEVVLLDKDATLSGGWDETFTTQGGASTIDGEGARRGVTVNADVTAVIEHFIVQNGFVAYSAAGGGILNDFGILTLDSSTISENVAVWRGGGIENRGILTLNSSTVTGNTATESGGGGILNYDGTITLNDSTVNGNTGGGIGNDGDAILNGSTVSANTGGGINGGSLVLNNCAVTGNTDGGINAGLEPMTLNNSTISGNTAGAYGGGINNYGATINLNNCTVSDNVAGYGGGIYNNSGQVTTAVVNLQNSILAGNTGGVAPDCYHIINTLGYNIIGDTSGCLFTPGAGDLTNVSGRLGLFVGSPGYHPLLPDSPAIDAGNPAGCMGSTGLLTSDQRGAPRVGRCDMGAYEYTIPGPAASIAAIGGTPQATPPFSPFEMLLQAAVLDNIGSPVDNATVTYSAPASGVSGTFADSGTYTTTALTDKGGIVTAASFTANGLEGSYTVMATVSGIITPANFLLSNGGGWYVAPGGDDANDCQTSTSPCATINGVLGKVGLVTGDTVLVTDGTYIGTGDEVVLLDKSIRLLGGWNDTFTAQSGTSTIDGEGARRGMTVDNDVTATVERFEVRNGSAEDGGGIYNYGGTLTLDNTTVSGNTATGYSGGGGGIYNYGGTLTLDNSVVSGNAATGSGYSGGGGIHNYEGAVLLNNSTVSSNTAQGGGGIGNGGTMVLNNSTVSGNTGGGIGNGGTLTLNNSTVSSNTGTYYSGSGGGVSNGYGGTLFLNSSTVTGNAANDGDGGGIYHGGTAMALQNTIVAGNTASGTGPDCSGAVGSSGYNLIGDISGCTFTPTTGDLLDVDARLFPLTGLPGYHPLLPGSRAIDAGNPAGCTDHLGNPLSTDQGGTPRPLDGDGDGNAICDMGAYEVDPEHPIRRLFLPLVLRNY